MASGQSLIATGGHLAIDEFSGTRSRVRFWTAGSPETRKKFATVFMVDDLDRDGVAHTEGKLHHRLALADHLVPEMLPDPQTNTGRLLSQQRQKALTIAPLGPVASAS